MTGKRAALAASVVLFLAATHGAAAIAAPRPDVGAGRIAWFDLTTKDMAKSRDFYGKLFGWTFDAVKGTDLAVQIVSGGTEIGSLRVAEGAISPFDGVVYVQVDDLPAACRKARELGATIPPGFPFNLSDGTGAIGLLTDPSGHPIGLYSRTPLPPAAPKGH
jgi:predicted enzyme related to lactoylglutathione lyase